VLSHLNIIGLAVTLLAMGVLFTTLSPYFLTVKNLLNIGRAVSIRGIVAAGLTLVLVSGGIDLTIGSNMAATGMLVAFLLRAGWPTPLAIAGGLAFGATLGLITSFFVTKVGINPLITTLGMMSIVRGAGYVVSGGISVQVPGASALPILSRGRLLGIPNPLIMWLAVCALCYFLLQYTRFGQYVFAIGGNDDACRVAGVKVSQVKTGTFVLCGVLAAFGGVLLTALGGGASPTNAQGSELDIIASVVLGGVSLSGGSGSIFGTMLGTLILGSVDNGMTLIGLRPYWQVVVRGAILMFAVTLDTLRTGGVHRRG
jgi:ribose/xylose/arabinose/galactoside ABC-type transport system permease subunit